MAEGGPRPSSECPSDSRPGTVNDDPLSSAYSRDPASSSDSTMRLLVALLLLDAYIRGAPIGQYMAAQYRELLHSYGRMPACGTKMVLEQSEL